jgi:glucose uptake protein
LIPQSYGAALALMILSMVAWGSWANTMKLVPKWPFQLFYWDYTIGVLLLTLVVGLTAGNAAEGEAAFLADLAAAGTEQYVYALAGGVVFNVANLLLVAAISIAGLAVAFPVGIGLALIVGVIWNYLLAPAGNPVLLFGGVALVALAIVVDALAFRAREAGAPGRTRGIGLSIFCGLLMGSFFPLVTRASAGPQGLGPYAVAVVFAVGVILCAIPVNTWLMKKPITDDPPTSFAQYATGGAREHLSGMLGGAIWAVGGLCSFVAGTAAIVGPATSYAMGQGATMIAAAWGVFIWREFAGAPAKARRLLLPMFVLFLAGLGTIAVAPLF